MSEHSINSELGPKLESELRGNINTWHDDLLHLLPSLPQNVEIVFDNIHLVPGSATGGAAWSLNKIKLAFDPDFNAAYADKINDLKASYYHECYHLSRGYSFETTPIDQAAIGIAIEEGLATKFESLYAGSNPAYAEYEDSLTMAAWLSEVKGLPKGFDYDWQKYKFYDESTGRKWILYKVGVFIIDEAIKSSPSKSFEDLSHLSVAQILELAK